VVEVARAESQGCPVRTKALASTSSVRMQAVTPLSAVSLPPAAARRTPAAMGCAGPRPAPPS